MGFCAATVASIVVPTHDHENIKHYTSADQSIYWLLAVFIGIAVFLLFWLSVLSLLANLFKFFTRTIEVNEVNEVKGAPNEDKPPKSPVNKDNKNMEEESEDYLKELEKAGPKVKSISQYKGKPATPPPTDDNQSVGDSYYKQLMKTQGNVASVSQYGNQ